MIAYHNDPAVKSLYLARVEAHRQADQLVQGYGYWSDGKGCAAGCTVHSGDHMDYETELGVPIMLAHLEDVIFEGLSRNAAREWPERFLSAIKPGQDLSRVGWKMQFWWLTDETFNPGIKHPLVSAEIKQCADIIAPLCDGLPVDILAAWSAESAARSARSAAESAAWSARSAARSAAWSAARSAWSAARSARSAAWSAESAARSAARSAAWSAESAAAWSKIADKLIELIGEAPMSPL